jgi:hypothetical protein
MLKEINISIDNLLLDPNNPRFSRDLNKSKYIPDSEVEGKQAETLSLFDRGAANDSEDVTNIKSLYESMITIGYVPIDRIVVRPIQNTNKYLVLEGNRRISSIKKILFDFEMQNDPFDSPRKRESRMSIMNSFDIIPCMLLDTEGLSQEDIFHKISIILGLRHHGSLLEWEPLPEAYNIYKVYMSLEPKTAMFEFTANKRKQVAARLSISPSKVKEALRTYIAYSQLKDEYDGVKDKHYSLIQSGITNKYLQDNLIRTDENTFRLDENSLEKIDQLCQFALRDQEYPANKKKILRDPKSFTRVGKLFQVRLNETNDAIRRYADDLIKQVMDENDAVMTVESAIDALTDFRNQTQWAAALEKLLDKQEIDLKIEEYSGEGNDRADKDELKKALQPLKLIMKL